MYKPSAMHDYKNGYYTLKQFPELGAMSLYYVTEVCNYLNGYTDGSKLTPETMAIINPQPDTFPMIEGEGAPQYTFALPDEPVQLALI
jgi:hypothetical protein